MFDLPPPPPDSAIVYQIPIAERAQNINPQVYQTLERALDQMSEADLEALSPEELQTLKESLALLALQGSYNYTEEEKTKLRADIDSLFNGDDELEEREVQNSTSYDGSFCRNLKLQKGHQDESLQYFLTHPSYQQKAKDSGMQPVAKVSYSPWETLKSVFPEGWFSVENASSKFWVPDYIKRFSESLLHKGPNSVHKDGWGYTSCAMHGHHKPLMDKISDKTKKCLHETAKFIKKHKKAIIITAVVIVAAVGVTYAIVALTADSLTAVGAAAATVGPVAGKVESSTSDTPKSPGGSTNKKPSKVVPLQNPPQDNKSEVTNTPNAYNPAENYSSLPYIDGNTALAIDYVQEEPITRPDIAKLDFVMQEIHTALGENLDYRTNVLLGFANQVSLLPLPIPPPVSEEEKRGRAAGRDIANITGYISIGSGIVDVFTGIGGGAAAAALAASGVGVPAAIPVGAISEALVLEGLGKIVVGAELLRKKATDDDFDKNGYSDRVGNQEEYGVQKHGTAGNNDVQNPQFRDAWQELQRRFGGRLTDIERRKFHDAVTKQGYTYQELIEEGCRIFDGK